MSEEERNKKPKKFNLLDWFCVAISVIVSLIIIFFYHENPPFYTFMSVVALNCGIIGTVFAIKGYRINYIFAFVESFAFFYTSWVKLFFGNALMNLLFYAPANLIGFYLWGKHSDKEERVIARSFTLTQSLIVTIVFFVSTIVLNIILTAFGGAHTIIDSASTVLAIFATSLAILRFREQWLFWLVADLLQLVIWTTTNDPAALALRIFFPLSSIYGYINWRKLLKKSKEEPSKT